jgi:RNA polymerase sigma-70 factor (ECF subfamily)
MTSDSWPPDFLNAHGAWMRRLARGLVRDPALAEDLSQEAWEAAFRHRPRPESARPWLLRVLRNRLRNHLRTDGRRQAREVKADAGETPATPEEVSERLELQRRIAALIAGLDPAGRQLIYERYYEDREPTEIARRLGIPAGTVRWRLKVTLDQLRARLDAEQGERRRWVLMLAPHSRVRGRRPPVVAATVVAVVGALAVVLGIRASRARHPALVEQAAARLLGAPRERPPMFQTASAPAPPPVADCPEAQTLRDELALRQRELAPRERHEAEWARSEPNPAAQKRFAPILDAVLGSGKCPYSLDCRGFVCHVEILAARGMRSYADCYIRTSEPTIEFVPRDYLNAWRPTSVNSGTPVRDPLSGLSFSRHDMYYWLATITGDPLPWAQQPKNVTLAPGRHRASAALPAARSGACRGEVARLQTQLAAVEAKGDLLLRPAEAFAVNEPNPALTAEVSSRIATVTGLAGDPFPLSVECRGPVCLVAPRDPADRSLDIVWKCAIVDGQERCPPDTDGTGWFARLTRASHHSDFFGFVEPARAPRREDVRAAYLRIRPPSDRDKLDPFVPLCAMEARVRRDGVLERCERLGGKGTLELRYLVPGPELEASDHRIALDGGGDLAGTPAGQCLLRGLREAAAVEDASDTRNGYAVYGRIELPGGLPTFWARHAERCRDFLK